MILLLIWTLEHKDLENWNNNNYYCSLLIFSQQWGLHSCTSEGLEKDQRDLGWNGCGHTQEPFWEAAVPIHSSRHPFYWTDWLKSENCLACVVFSIHIERWWDIIASIVCMTILNFQRKYTLLFNIVTWSTYEKQNIQANKLYPHIVSCLQE